MTVTVLSHVRLLLLVAAEFAMISEIAMVAGCMAKNGPTVPEDSAEVSPALIGQTAPAFDLLPADGGRYRSVPDALEPKPLVPLKK